MDLIEIHRNSFANKKILKQAKKCGCFYCCRIFSTEEITMRIEDDPDSTALCPYCFVDSVIAESKSIILSKELLEKIHEIYF